MSIQLVTGCLQGVAVQVHFEGEIDLEIDGAEICGGYFGYVVVDVLADGYGLGPVTRGLGWFWVEVLLGCWVGLWDMVLNWID